MGCRQITPHLVGLASRLQDKPFHLIASHCQDISSRPEVIAYLRNNRMSAFAPNLTITKDGRHPDVKGIGLMPYYILFDHTGKLVHHGMGGSYHGGDGLAMIDSVDKLLKDAPAIYLGPEPFERVGPLASKISSGKGLGGSLKTLEAQLAAAPDEVTKAELERLQALVVRYRDDEARRIDKMVGGQPSGVIPAMKDLVKTFKGTALGPDLETKLAAYEDSDALADAVKFEKDFLKIAKSFEKVKESKRTDALIASTVQKLEKLLEGRDALPFAQTVQAFLMDLR